MKVAVISDIHANIFALDAVYKDLEKERIDYILVVGDLVGYYYWPKEVIDRLRDDERVICIRGNHEDLLLETLMSSDKSETLRKKYGSGYDVCHETLSNDDITWLSELPKNIELIIDNCSFYLSHGSLTETDEYLYPDASIDRLLKNYSHCKFTIFGHTHYPFIHTYDNKVLINPGSVGQPRDVGGLASYVIINTDNFSTRFKRLRFDFLPIIEIAKSRDGDLDYLWKIMER